MNFQFLELNQEGIKLSATISSNFGITRNENFMEGDSIQIFKKILKDYDLFLKDDILVKDLQDAVMLRRFKLGNYVIAINWSNQVLLMIDEELKRLENQKPIVQK